MSSSIFKKLRSSSIYKKNGGRLPFTKQIEVVFPADILTKYSYFDIPMGGRLAGLTGYCDIYAY